MSRHANAHALHPAPQLDAARSAAESALAAAQDEINSLQARLSATDSDLASAKAAYEQTAAELSALRAERDSSSNTSDALEREVAGLKAAVERLQIDVDEKQILHEQAQQRAVVLEEQLVASSRELQAVVESRTIVESSARAAQDEAESLGAQLRDAVQASAHVTALEEQLRETRAELQSLDELVLQERSAAQSAQASLEQAQAAADHAAREIQTLRQLNASSQAEAAALTDELSGVRDQAGSLGQGAPPSPSVSLRVSRPRAENADRSPRAQPCKTLKLASSRQPSSRARTSKRSSTPSRRASRARPQPRSRSSSSWARSAPSKPRLGLRRRRSPRSTVGSQSWSSCSTPRWSMSRRRTRSLWRCALAAPLGALGRATLAHSRPESQALKVQKRSAAQIERLKAKVATLQRDLTAAKSASILAAAPLPAAPAPPSIGKKRPAPNDFDAAPAPAPRAIAVMLDKENAIEAPARRQARPLSASSAMAASKDALVPLKPEHVAAAPRRAALGAVDENAAAVSSLADKAAPPPPASKVDSLRAKMQRMKSVQAGGVPTA